MIHLSSPVRRPLRAQEEQALVVRCYCETRYGATSWHCEGRVAARIEVSPQVLDIRYVNIAGGSDSSSTTACARRTVRPRT
jgi:hypothetical protein